MIDLEEEGIYRPIPYKGEASYSPPFLYKKVVERDDWPIILQPDYQREHVWDTNQKSEFMGYLLEGNQTQNLIWNDRGLPEGYAVVDGQQRMFSVIDFMDNEIPARVTNPETGEERDIYVDQLNEMSMRILRNIRLQVKIMEASKQRAMEVYIRINSGGTVHDEEEIDKVRKMLDSEGS